MVRRLSIAALVLGLLALAAVGLTFWYVCPCERTPGGPLQFVGATAPVEDWGFANEVGPYLKFKPLFPGQSANCMSDQQKLYISCALRRKILVNNSVAQRFGRIAVGDRAYPVRMRRLLAPSELDLAWRARAQKTGRGLDQPRAMHWWSFELTSVRER